MDRALATASAPGKVILHGEHAVVFGRPALAAALGLRTTAELAELPAAELRLDLPAVRLQEVVPMPRVAALLVEARAAAAWSAPQSVDHSRLLRAVDVLADEGPPREPPQRNALRGALYLVAGLLGDAPPRSGLALTVRSELATGAGAGSSAAFAVSVAAALLQLRCGLARGAPLSAEDARLVSAWAFNCERIMHGAPSGVDNSASALGGLLWFRRGAEPRSLSLRAPLRVLLVDTRVRRQTAALAARVGERRARNAAAVESVLSAIEHVTDAALQVLQVLQQLPGDAASGTAGDAASGTAGDAASGTAGDAASGTADDAASGVAGGAAGDADATRAQYEHLAELWDMNHWLLGALGASHAALEDVRRRAARRGLAAKLTGAGGGGCCLVLLPPGARSAELADELRAAGYGVTDTLLGGAGVRLH